MDAESGCHAAIIATTELKQAQEVNKLPPVRTSTEKRLAKEYRDLESSRPEGIHGGPADSSSWFNWRATIPGPVGTPYEGGLFTLLITFPDAFPFKPMFVKFESSVYHYQFTEAGGISLAMLSHDWSPALTVKTVLLAIHSLLANPTDRYILRPELRDLFKRDRTEYERRARAWTQTHQPTQ